MKKAKLSQQELNTLDALMVRAITHGQVQSPSPARAATVQERLAYNRAVRGDFSAQAHLTVDLQKLVADCSVHTGTVTYITNALLDKIACITIGDPTAPDHWLAMQGYIQLAMDCIVGASENNAPPLL